MKVFELAKELNVGAVDLVDKLRANGINVKNHMVLLTEDELIAAKKLFETSKADKTVVKKVIKKKVTKAPEVQVKSQTAASESADDENQKSSPQPQSKKEETQNLQTAGSKKIVKKAVTVKRKTKKDIEDEQIAFKEEQAAIAEGYSLDEEQDVSLDDAVKSFYEEDRPRGLEIISRPEMRTVTAKNDSTAVVSKEKGVYKEKMHTFTPIFVPEGTKPDAQTGKNIEQRFKPAPSNVDFDPSILEDDDSNSSKSKKRFGDLAAMVSKKVEKKDLELLRADEELKFAHEVVGQAIYTPIKKKKVWMGEKKKTEITEVKESKRILHLHHGCTAGELAQKLSVKFDAFANMVLKLNLLVDEEDYIGLGLAAEIANLYNYRVENTAFDESKVINKGKEVSVTKNNSEHLTRSPIVTIMGHVDHGKTSLLDYIRKEKVASGEAGGITQHIGAYSVNMNDSKITFLDTPGHAAFAKMRQRGANVTDVVVLVVAADDGVMPQTVESIKFIQNAKVPMIVAINKMDKSEAKPERVKQELMQYGITPEEWGGDTQFVEVSALKGTGVDKLLESILVQAEVMDLRADTKSKAECVVIEAKLEVGRGPVCTVIVKTGTLKKGDSIVSGITSGRARSLMDHTGKMLDSALPSTPVQILGLESVPSPGDDLLVVDSEREAKKIIQNRIDEKKALDSAESKKLSLEDFFATSDNEAGGKKVLKLIIRSDVIGSYEAIKNAVEALGNSEVGVNVISGGAGAITDNDVLLASSTKGYVIGFNMRPVTSARKLAEDKGVDVKTYTIIYELIDDIKLALEGLLTPDRIEKYIGRAQVKEVFNIPKIGAIAGSQVIDGKIERGCNIRLLRDGKIVFDGKLSSLKRFKDDAKEVKNGLECGIALEGYNDIKANDLFEAYLIEEVRRKLEEQQATL